jgi:hypothetical protein
VEARLGVAAVEDEGEAGAHFGPCVWWRRWWW